MTGVNEIRTAFLSFFQKNGHEIVASMRDIIRIEEADIPWAGCLVPGPDGLVMTLRSTDTRGKKRFTAFHEAMHTYLPGFSTQIHYRCDPSAPLEAGRVRDRDLEALCDIGAAELLFPRSAFRAELGERVPTMHLVEDLARRFDASLEATARRLVSIRDAPSLLVALEPARKPSQPHAEPALRVQWRQSAGTWPYVPRHKSVPTGSTFDRALQGEIVNEITDLSAITVDSTIGVHISAQLYPYNDDRGELHMRVLALIVPVPYPGHRHGS